MEVSETEGYRLVIELLRSKHKILLSLDKTINQSEVLRIKDYEKLVASFNRDISSDKTSIKIKVQQHVLFAIGVTLLSIAITLCGLAMINRRKNIWIVAMVFGTAGAGVVFYTMMLMFF